MKLQDQVCTLEQARRLKELGVHGDTVFQWAGMLTDANGKWHGFVQLAVTLNSIPAYSVAELGVMINWDYVTVSAPYKQDKYWNMFMNEADFVGEHEAELRAQVLIHLLENKLITPEQVNNSLTSAN